MGCLIKPSPQPSPPGRGRELFSLLPLEERLRELFSLLPLGERLRELFSLLPLGEGLGVRDSHSHD